MKITVLGTSNSIIGRNGFIKALAAQHDVRNLSIGMVPYYMHISQILDNLADIEASDLLIVDHLSNPGFLKSYDYDVNLKFFYDLLSSINTNVVILCFPHIGDEPGKPLRRHRQRSIELAKERNIPFLYFRNSLFTRANFKDHQHIHIFPSFLIGLYMNEIFKNLPAKPNGGHFKGVYNLKPEAISGSVKNSLLERNFFEITSDSTVSFTFHGEILALQYVASGNCYLDLNDQGVTIRNSQSGVFFNGFDYKIVVNGEFILRKSTKPSTSDDENKNLKFVSLLCRKDFSFTPVRDRQNINFDFTYFTLLLDVYNRFTFDSEIDDGFIDLIRDSALRLETSDKLKAKSLMSKAAIFRPSGTLIQKKLKEYSE